MRTHTQGLAVSRKLEDIFEFIENFHSMMHGTELFKITGNPVCFWIFWTITVISEDRRTERENKFHPSKKKKKLI